MQRNRVRELRIARGFMSQRSFAEFVTKNCGWKISHGTINELENQEANPTWDKIDKLATFFGVSVDYLMGRSDKRGA